MSKPKFHLDKSIVSLGDLGDDAEQKTYWLSKTPLERLEALESLRQNFYGYDAVADRVQRVLTVVELGQS